MTEHPLYGSADYHRALRLDERDTTGHAAAWRSPFRRDYARLVHSAAFRRLQGKTQLFAGLESDFFRNRLTHSLEVAQVAKSIALRLNATRLGDRPLDLDLVELAGLAHDLGHPPFGHTGENVLDELMREDGGFEGNAQTLRILCRLEKKLDDPERQFTRGEPIWFDESGREAAVGLNLCSRSLAAILKYDRPIPHRRRGGAGVVKGYYLAEEQVVERVWSDVLGGDVDAASEARRTVECQIMDLADDIAYSTYDLEDGFKAGLLTPLDLLSPSEDVLGDVAVRVGRELQVSIPGAEVTAVLRNLFGAFAKATAAPPKKLGAAGDWYADELAHSYRASRTAAENGFLRTALTSELVNRFMQAVDVEVDARFPALSTITMHDEERREVSVLKHLTYVLLIRSNRMRLVAHRAGNMVREIFAALADPGGEHLLPPDVAERQRQAPKDQKRRVVCDYIAGMTDRYAIEFYARLTSETFYSMFKPH